MPNVWLPKMPLVVAANTCMKPGCEPINIAPRPQPAAPYPWALAAPCAATTSVEAATNDTRIFIDFIEIPSLRENVTKGATVEPIAHCVKRAPRECTPSDCAGTRYVPLMRRSLWVVMTLCACGEPILRNAPKPDPGAVAGVAAAAAAAVTLASPDAAARRQEQRSKGEPDNRGVVVK